MEGLVFDIRNFSVHDGPGIRTTIFLKGCPLRCAWCHNPEGLNNFPEKINKNISLDSINFNVIEEVGYFISVDSIIEQIIPEKIFFEKSKGGITISGGEPLMQAEFTKALLIAAKANNIHTALDTSGFVKSEIFQDVVSHSDLVLFDIKFIDPKKHKRFTGQDNSLILENFRWLVESGIPVIVRIPLIPGITDTEENLADVRHLLEGIDKLESVDLLPYHHFAKAKYQKLNLNYELSDLKKYSDEKLEEIKTKVLSFDVGPLISKSSSL